MSPATQGTLRDAQSFFGHAARAGYSELKREKTWKKKLICENPSRAGAVQAGIDYYLENNYAFSRARTTEK